MEAPDSRCPSYYPTTIWSELERAGSADSEEAQTALAGLVRRYYRPLQAHIEFKFGVDGHRSQDWLQGFIHTKILVSNLLVTASRERGRFRTFLLNSLDNYITSQLRHDKAQKRSPEKGMVSLEELAAGSEIPGLGDGVDPYAVEWAREVLFEAVGRMEQECLDSGNGRRWELFRARILDPAMNGGAGLPYPVIVEQLRFDSPAQASNVLTTAKRQFARILRHIVAEYAGEGVDIESEMADLKQALLQRP